MASASRNSTPACAHGPSRHDGHRRGRPRHRTGDDQDRDRIDHGNRSTTARARIAPGDERHHRDCDYGEDEPEAHLSARRCIGARDAAPGQPVHDLGEHGVRAHLSARMTIAPTPLSVRRSPSRPAPSRPDRLAVSIDSSTLDRPSITSPSTAPSHRANAQTIADVDVVSGMSPPCRQLATGAPSSVQVRAELEAAEVLERAFSSRICPIKVSETMIAAASKYAATRPRS